VDKSLYPFVTIQAYDRQTDRETDRILITRGCLHSMRHNKNHDNKHCTYVCTHVTTVAVQSFKVTNFAGNRQPIYDFLLVILVLTNILSLTCAYTHCAHTQFTQDCLNYITKT